MGRTYADAPDVDGVTLGSQAATIQPGDLVSCRIIDSQGYDLVARPVSDSVPPRGRRARPRPRKKPTASLTILDGMP